MWFDETFLHSLYERIGINNPAWLTLRQTKVCCRYMTPETVIVETRFGDRQRHTNYNYTWSGRKVVLSYSHRNGCGTITFYPDDSEKRQLFEKYCEEKRKQILDDAARRIDRAKKFVDGKSRLSDKYTLEEYIQRLTKQKHKAADNFHCYLWNYRKSAGEEKTKEGLRMYEEYHKYISLKECIRIAKKVTKLAE